MRVDRIAGWLRRTSPGLYRVLEPPWQHVKRFLPIDEDYWARRKHYNYYAEVVRLAKRYVPEGGRAIDVGAGVTELLRDLSWFQHRVALDRARLARQPGIECVHADFLQFRSSGVFDLVLCLQVLEHLDNPTPFTQKLLGLGRTVIISVPYKWPKGFYPPHVQDPVDEAKLESWTRRKPSETVVVRDQAERLIAVYSGNRA